MQFLKKSYNTLIISARVLIFKLNDKCPLIGRPLVTTWNALCALKFTIWKKIFDLRIRLKYNIDKADLNHNKIWWVNPQKIKHSLILPPKAAKKWYAYEYSGALEGKLRTEKFEDLDVYKAFKQRFREGKQWDETEFYERVMGQIDKGINKWGCESKEDWHQRLKKLDLLYEQIKSNGYKSKKELHSSKGLFGRLERPLEVLDEVAVVIGEQGELLFINGRHRLSIAKLLELQKIPISIIGWHKKWLDFKKELAFFAQEHQRGKLYQPLTHPDIQDIPFHHGGRRFNIIKDRVSLTGGTFLDIGAHLGYFCHKFEEQGFDCYALEENRTLVYFLEKLKKAENRRFKIIPESLFEYKKAKELKFDIILALNIFHHFLEKKDTYLNLIEFLKRMRVKEFFFEAHLPSTEKNKNRYQEYNPNQFVNFIIENSCLNKAEFIGKAEDGRPLYKLTP